MENINSYDSAISNANLLRNANFSTLSEQADRFVDKEKEVREKIEGSTLPFEVPVLEHTLGDLGKKALVKAGLRSADDEDSITKSLLKKGLNSVLQKIKGDAGITPDTESPVPAPRDPASIRPTPKPRPQSSLPESDEVKSLRQAQTDAENLRDQTASDLEDAKNSVSDATQDLANKQQALTDAQNLVDSNTERATAQAGGPVSQSQQISDANDRSALNDARNDVDNAKDALDDAKQNVSDTQDLLDTHTNLANQAKTDVENATKTTVEEDVSAQAEKTAGKTLAQRLAEKAGMAEIEGGGPEDMAGDLIAGGLAIASFFASIFGKKIKRPDPESQLPSLQLKVSQGFGLAGN